MKTEYKLIKTTHINRDKNCTSGENSLPAEDSFIDNLSDLYKFGLKEYGRCTSKIYIDRDKDSTVHIGYVFIQRLKYDDSNEYFINETWLSLEHYIEEINREYLTV